MERRGIGVKKWMIKGDNRIRVGCFFLKGEYVGFRRGRKRIGKKKQKRKMPGGFCGGKRGMKRGKLL